MTRACIYIEGHKICGDDGRRNSHRHPHSSHGYGGGVDRGELTRRKRQQHWGQQREERRYQDERYYDRRPSVPYYRDERYGGHRDGNGDIGGSTAINPEVRAAADNGVIALKELAFLLQRNDFSASALGILLQDADDNGRLDNPRALRQVFGRDVQIGRREDGPRAAEEAARMIQDYASRSGRTR